MPFNSVRHADTLTPGFLTQQIIDSALYHNQDIPTYGRMMYESWRLLGEQGITPRASSKGAYIQIIAGEDAHVYAEMRVSETLKRAALIDLINKYVMPDFAPLSATSLTVLWPTWVR